MQTRCWLILLMLSSGLFKCLIGDLYSSLINHWNRQLKPYLFPLRKNRVNQGHNLSPLAVLGLRGVFQSVRQTFAVISQTFAIVSQTLAVISQTFAVNNQTFAVFSQTFSVIFVILNPIQSISQSLSVRYQSICELDSRERP